MQSEDGQETPLGAAVLGSQGGGENRRQIDSTQSDEPSAPTVTTVLLRLSQPSWSDEEGSDSNRTVFESHSATAYVVPEEPPRCSP